MVVRGAELLDGRESAVRRAVVYKDEFVFVSRFDEFSSRLIDDSTDHFLRVVTGDNYRNKHKAPP